MKVMDLILNLASPTHHFKLFHVFYQQILKKIASKNSMTLQLKLIHRKQKILLNDGIMTSSSSFSWSVSSLTWRIQEALLCNRFDKTIGKVYIIDLDLKLQKLKVGVYQQSNPINMSVICNKLFFLLLIKFTWLFMVKIWYQIVYAEQLVLSLISSSEVKLLCWLNINVTSPKPDIGL